MYFPEHEDHKNIPEALQTGSSDLDNGTFIPYCSKFKYLGSVLMPDLDDTTEMKRCLSLAQMVFNDFWKISVHLWHHLYQVCVLPSTIPTSSP
jgi:hypothetical protein